MKKFLTLTLLSLLVGVSAQADTAKLYVYTGYVSWWDATQSLYLYANEDEHTDWNTQTINPEPIDINGRVFDVYTYDTKYTIAVVRRGDGSLIHNQTTDIGLSGSDMYIELWNDTYEGKQKWGDATNTYSSWTSRTLKAYWMSSFDWAEPDDVMRMYSYGEAYINGDWPGSSSNVTFVGKRDDYNVWKWEQNVNATSSFLSSLKLMFVGGEEGHQESTYYDSYRSTLGMTCSTNGIWWKDWVEQDSPATYSRTFTSTNGSTVCLPFALNEAQAAEYGKFYELKSADGDNVVFSSVESTEACVPYYFVPKAAGVTISSAGKTIEFDLSKMDVTVGNGDVTFSGTLAATSKSGVYGFQGGNLVYAAQAVNIPEFRAYLTAAAGAKLSLSFEDETGINTISRSNTDNVYYDLQGRRVMNPTKGLFIVNGKKVIR